MKKMGAAAEEEEGKILPLADCLSKYVRRAVVSPGPRCKGPQKEEYFLASA